MRLAAAFHLLFFGFLGCLANVAWIAFVRSPTPLFGAAVLLSLVRVSLAFAMVGFVAGVAGGVLDRPSEYRYQRSSGPILWGLTWSVIAAVPGAFAGIALAWLDFGFLRLLPRLTPGLVLGACVGILVTIVTWRFSSPRVPSGK
jgi:hypothetical protein